MNSKKRDAHIKFIIFLGIILLVLGFSLPHLLPLGELPLEFMGVSTKGPVAYLAIPVGVGCMAPLLRSLWRPPSRAPTRPEIVAAVIIHDNRVAMVKRREPEASGRLRWQFPSGTLKESQLLHGRLREIVKEETNLVVSIEEILSQRRHPDTNKEIAYFRCKCLSGDIRNDPPQENEKAEWVPAREVANRIETDHCAVVKAYISEEASRHEA